MLAILNTPILTNYGSFTFKSITIDYAKTLIHREKCILSAIGHKATAEILSHILERDIPANRVEYKQERGDVALVFKLNRRIEEGRVLTKQEIEEIGYTFGILILN